MNNVIKGLGEPSYSGRAVIYPVATLCEYSLRDSIKEDFVEQVIAGNLIAGFSFKDEFLKKIAKDIENCEDDDEKDEYFMEILHNLKGGYVILYELPVVSNVKEGLKSYTTYGYGYYGTHFVYVNDLLEMNDILREVDRRIVLETYEKEQKDKQ